MYFVCALWPCITVCTHSMLCLWCDLGTCLPVSCGCRHAAPCPCLTGLQAFYLPCHATATACLPSLSHLSYSCFACVPRHTHIHAACTDKAAFCPAPSPSNIARQARWVLLRCDVAGTLLVFALCCGWDLTVCIPSQHWTVFCGPDRQAVAVRGMGTCSGDCVCYDSDDQTLLVCFVGLFLYNMVGCALLPCLQFSHLSPTPSPPPSVSLSVSCSLPLVVVPATGHTAFRYLHVAFCTWQ